MSATSPAPHTLEEIQAAKDAGPEALQALMLPVESVFESLPLLVAEPRLEQHLYNGCPTSRYPAADGLCPQMSSSRTPGVLKVENCRTFMQIARRSAVKINGQPLYKLAREGTSPVERKAPPHRITWTSGTAAARCQGGRHTGAAASALRAAGRGGSRPADGTV